MISPGSRWRICRAIVGMLTHMNLAFEGIQFEPQNQQNHVKPHLIGPFMAHFDAIFTLNQDLLLERHYLDDLNFWLSRPPDGTKRTTGTCRG
jgi:hypothetical protein